MRQSAITIQRAYRSWKIRQQIEQQVTSQSANLLEMNATNEISCSSQHIASSSPDLLCGIPLVKEMDRMKGEDEYDGTSQTLEVKKDDH